MKVSAELLASFQHAERLTEEEIKALLAYYNGVRLALMPCPPEYKLMLNDVRVKCDRLQDMVDAHKEARKQGAKWAQNYSTVVREAGQQVDCVV